MTLDEAKAIGRIASTADDGCPTCVRELTDMLAKQFPQFTWTYPGRQWEEIDDWGDEKWVSYRTGIDVEHTAPKPVDEVK